MTQKGYGKDTLLLQRRLWGQKWRYTSLDGSRLYDSLITGEGSHVSNKRVFFSLTELSGGNFNLVLFINRMNTRPEDNVQNNSPSVVLWMSCIARAAHSAPPLKMPTTTLLTDSPSHHICHNHNISTRTFILDYCTPKLALETFLSRCQKMRRLVSRMPNFFAIAR